MNTEPPPILFRDLFESKPDPARVELVSSPVIADINRTYRPWRKARAIARDAGLDPLKAWWAVKLARLTTSQTLPIKQMNGEPFRYSQTAVLSETLHRIDLETGGGDLAPFDPQHKGFLADPDNQRRFFIKSMMEEAINSSIIEGAVTTIELAMDLLRSGRRARTPDEMMVTNNYAAMQAIKTWLQRPLTPEMLCELQTILTRDTLANPSQSGRFRLESERVVVAHEKTGEVIFQPPPAATLKQRVSALCDFANRSHTGDSFMHPLVKACILHFMIGYIHPFADGNGRTTRAIFYWCALRSGYRVFEFLAISEMIRQARSKYPQAYIDVEQDDGDLTYFIFYKMGVIRRSLDRLATYLKEEETKVATSLRLIQLDPDLNLRQRLLLEYALRHPKTQFTAKSHANSNSITVMTARTDLEKLRKRGLLNTMKVRQEVAYLLAPDVPARLAKLSLP